MRVTEGLIAEKYLYNQERIAEKKMKLQIQLANDSRIEKLTDDVSGSLELIKLDALIKKTDTYAKNADSAMNFMKVSLDYLDQATTNIQNIMSIAETAKDAINVQNYQTIATSIKNSLSSIVQSINAKHNGMYCFGGTNYTADPVTIDGNGRAAESALDHSGEVKIQLSGNSKESMNIPGSVIFNSGILESINSIIDSLESGSGPSTTELQNLSTAYNNFLDIQSLSGEKLNKFENFYDLLQNQSSNYTEMLVNVQKVDTAKVATDLQRQDYLLQVSYKLLANAFPQSVFDFL
jgi:flagellar hook-associated protein 3 FlgL